MDPNAALARVRALCAVLLSEGYDLDPAPAIELAETVEGLDEWLTRKGFLPAAWSRAALGADR